MMGTAGADPTTKQSSDAATRNPLLMVQLTLKANVIGDFGWNILAQDERINNGGSGK
jgi:hypothetical protein